VNDLEITALVKRLARAHASGGIVIERAAILAAGADYPAIMDWITAHAGTTPASRQPMRFVLPANTIH
jgi:hypothetical protein